MPRSGRRHDPCHRKRQQDPSRARGFQGSRSDQILPRNRAAKTCVKTPRRRNRRSPQGPAGAGPASGITWSRTAGSTESSPVNGRLCDAISTTETPTPVAKIAMMMRLAARLSLWTMAMVSKVRPACTSSTVHLTQLIDDLLRMMRWRRASNAFWRDATSSRWATTWPSLRGLSERGPALAPRRVAPGRSSAWHSDGPSPATPG